MTIEITQAQVNGFRMDQQFLTQRASKKDIDLVATQVCGIQAQMPKAASLQLWSRIQDLKPEDVNTALWTTKTLVRTWCMRGTAHYLPTSQFPAYLKAIIEPRIPRHKKWLAKRGIREFGEVAKFDPSQHDFEAILSAVTKALAAGPATRDEVANIVAEEVGPEARPWVDTGYYIVTKLLAYEGKVCFGPDLEGKATLVLTEQWLDKQPFLEKEPAENTILLYFLKCYGPATPQDFAAWSGLKMTPIKAIWERNLSQLAQITVNGKSHWIPQSDLDALINTTTDSRPLRLLSHFDVFLLGHKNKVHIVDKAHYKLVFKKAAWIAPVILQDGTAIGTWKQKRTAKKITITAEPFRTLTKSQLEEVEAETQRLGKYFDIDSDVKVMK
ncbi:MAG: winged helix DNA-binding domain-containing protein [Promethearchaeota archaeon]